MIKFLCPYCKKPLKQAPSYEEDIVRYFCTCKIGLIFNYYFMDKDNFYISFYKKKIFSKGIKKVERKMKFKNLRSI